MGHALRICSVLGAAALMGILGCDKRSAGTRAVDSNQLRAADAALTKAVEDKDLERIMEFYAEDAAILPVTEPMVTGRQGVRSEWERLLSILDFRNSSTTTKVEVSRAGDLGYTQGTYVATFDLAIGTTATERGKWVTVWRKQTSGWKVAIDIYNTDEPPPAHQ